MKKYFSVILSILIALSLVSCGNTFTFECSEYIISKPLPLSGVKLDYVPQSLASYKNIAFALADGKVERIDIVSGARETVLDSSSAIAIGCDGGRLVAVSSSAVSVYDYDGERFAQIPLEATIGGIADIAIGGNCVVFADTAKPSKIYYADLKAETVTLLPDTWRIGARDAQVARVDISSDGAVCLSYSYNHGLAGSSLRVIGYDIESDAILSKLDPGASAQYGAFSSAGEFYYIENYNSGTRTVSAWRQFISKISVDGTSSNVMMIDNDGLKELGIEPKDFYRYNSSDPFGSYEVIIPTDRYSLEYADGESFVVWNQTAGTVAAFSTDSELEALVLLVPDDYTKYDLNELIVKYTVKTGRQVVTVSYPQEEYDDRLRTKLLAGDSDFDLFISNAELLRSILENTAYQPLDGYEELTENFDNVLADGVRGLMTADGGLFGVPMRINFWGCLKLTGEYNVPQSWTTAELFELCDNIPDGKRVYGDRFMLTRTIFNYIEDMIQKDGGIDKQELSGFFGKLKEYNDSGVLCDGDNDPILTYGAVFFSMPELQFNDVENQVMTIAPTRSGTKYLELGRTMLMNRASESKDFAAELLTLMTSPEVVYNNDDFAHILSLMGRDIKRNSCYNGLTDSKKEILEYSMSMYQNSRPSKLDSAEGLPQFIAYDVVECLFNGDITPDEAAQKVIDEVAYVYFE